MVWQVSKAHRPWRWEVLRAATGPCLAGQAGDQDPGRAM
jgi:hypothetical protein